MQQHRIAVNLSVKISAKFFFSWKLWTPAWTAERDEEPGGVGGPRGGEAVVEGPVRLRWGVGGRRVLRHPHRRYRAFRALAQSKGHVLRRDSAWWEL